TQLGAAIKQPPISTTPKVDTLETIKKVIPFTGTLSPGSPVVVYIRLPYRASLTYRRWISQDKVDTLGIVPPANLELELPRSEEHTSELQSRFDLVCRLLLEKK